MHAPGSRPEPPAPLGARSRRRARVQTVARDSAHPTDSSTERCASPRVTPGNQPAPARSAGWAISCAVRGSTTRLATLQSAQHQRAAITSATRRDATLPNPPCRHQLPEKEPPLDVPLEVPLRGFASPIQRLPEGLSPEPRPRFGPEPAPPASFVWFRPRNARSERTSAQQPIPRANVSRSQIGPNLLSSDSTGSPEITTPGKASPQPHHPSQSRATEELTPFVDDNVRES